MITKNHSINFASRKHEADAREAAIDQLISARRCRTTKNRVYDTPVYGRCLNCIDGTRKWLYDELLNKAKKTYARTKAAADKPDSEKLEIEANKTVLYVSSADIQRIMKKAANQ